MAATSFPRDRFWKTWNTDEVEPLGGLTFARDGQLEAIVLTVYRHGAAAGCTATLRLYHDAALTKLYATGTALNLQTAWSAGSAWIGRVRFDFATPPHVEAGQVYYVAVATTDYTRVGNTFWVGAATDWPHPLNTNTTSTGACAMSPLVRRGVTR